ncbi:ABC transporter substrate-binding protein [Candidatus Chloroploca sp. Khr17]|uniref:ABC transporter substrate-binding protein n=1 Tax=Candidatus Chloroploca sp. Khr17 TaxID=2496869 RepID=UPI00101E1F1C|nr:ABC transporter substrate-binding protein [Candidatus Chloroploca sp. Khr17]
MRKEYRILVVGLLVSIFYSACVPVPPPQAAAPAPKTLKVLILPFLSFAPYFIAQENGYFAEQGLEVEFVQMQQGTEAIPALVQSQIDVYGGFINAGLLNAISQDVNVKLVADKGYIATTSCGADDFMTPQNKAIQSALADASQRANLRFSANTASVEGYFISQLVAPFGMTLNDVRIEYIADPAAELDALNNGAIDVALVSEPWVTRITQADAGQVWQPVSAIAPDFQSGIIAFGPTLLTEDRAAGERFMVAYLKAVQKFAEGKTDRNVAIIAQYTKLDPALLRDMCWTTFRGDGSINTASITEFADWARENNLLDTVPTPAIFWDGSFVDFANKALGTTP